MDQNEESLLCYLNLCSVMVGDFGPAIQTAGIIFFVLVFNFLAKKLLINLRTHFAKTNNFWASSLTGALLKPLSYFVWYVAIICSIDNIASSLSGFHLININLILILGGVLSFGWFLLGLNSRVTHLMIERSQNHLTPLDAGKLDLIGKIVTVTILLMTIFMVLDLTGYNMQTIITFGGIGGLAIAFASQQVVSNFFGGLMIYTTRPFTIGEKIELPERKIEGYVEEIGWYLTKIRNLEKQPIYLSNSIITQTVIITHSRMTHERFHPIIGLRYKDIQNVKEIVNEIKLFLLKYPHIDQNASIDVSLMNFGAYALEIEVSAFVLTTCGTNFKSIRQDLLLNIAEIVSAAGGEITNNNNQTIEISGPSPYQLPVVPHSSFMNRS